MSAQFVNLSNTSSRPDDGRYGSVIKKIQEDAVCPFCPEQLLNYHTKPILKDSTHWLVTENMYPYSGTQYHFLFIHKKHISHIKELTPEAQKDLFDLINWTVETYKIPGGAFLMRFGDSTYTGATVTHLHAHIAVVDPAPGHEPVLARVG